MADLCVECGRFVPRACRDIVTAFNCPFDLFSLVPTRGDLDRRAEREAGEGAGRSAKRPNAPPQFGTSPD
jgi:hypothetical protein